MNKYSLFLFCFSMLFFSCVKDKPNPDHLQLPDQSYHGVILVNEGAFGNNNGDLSFIDLNNNIIYNQLYKLSNNKSLGDIIQSATLINDKYYIAINNSNKIVVIDRLSFKEMTIIHGIQSPRYILQVNPNTAYISSLYNNLIYVLDIPSNTIKKTISIDSQNPEAMKMIDQYCYVTSWDTASSTVYKINTLNDSIEKRIDIQGRASHGIQKDINNHLWILSGNKYKNKISHLTRYNPSTQLIDATFTFKSDEDPFRLTMNSRGDTLYFININYAGASTNNGLYKMSIYDLNLPTMPFISAPPNSYFWAVGIDSLTNHIFLSDPKGFTQQTTIYQYSNNGELINQFNAGIGTNSFIFKYK